MSHLIFDSSKNETTLEQKKTVRKNKGKGKYFFLEDTKIQTNFDFN